MKRKGLIKIAAGILLIIGLSLLCIMVNAEGGKADGDINAIDYAKLSVHEGGSGSITRSLSLSCVGEVNGSAISWSSSNTRYISDSGRVIRPRFDEGNAAVTLTANAVGTDQSTACKTFKFTVLADPVFKDPSYMSDEDFFGKWENNAWTVKGKFDYSYAAGLSGVEAAVKSGDYGVAADELLAYMKNRANKVSLNAVRNTGWANMLVDDFYHVRRSEVYQGEMTLDDAMGTASAEVNKAQLTNGLVSYTIRSWYNEKGYAKIVSGDHADADKRPAVRVTYTNGTTESFQILKDVTVAAGDNKASNFGYEHYLYAETFGDFLGNKTRHAIVTFDLSALTDEKLKAIARAELIVTGCCENTAAKEKRLIVLREPTAIWDEDTVCWNSVKGVVYSFNGLPEKNNWKKIENNDSEYLWQSSRFEGLSTVALEYTVSKNEDYAYKAMRIMEDFILDTGNFKKTSATALTEDSSGLRGGYPRSLDTAAKNNSFGSTFDTLIQSEYATADHCKAVLKNIWDTAHFLITYHSGASGNWRQHELVSVMNTTIYFPEFLDVQSGEGWREYAADILERHLFDSSLNDGTYYEATDSYSVSAFSDFQTFKYHMLNWGFNTSAEYDALLLKAAYYNALLMMPNGRGIQYGDSSLRNMNYGTYQRTCDWFNTEELRYITSLGRYGTEPLWTSRLFPDGRTAVMRSNWTTDSPYLFTNVRGGGSHGHSDDNGVVVYAYGKTLLNDAGMFEYDESDPYRQWGKSSAAHNTVVINDLNQKNDGETGTVKRFTAAGNLDYLRQSTFQTEGFEHERSIAFLKSGIWFIHDKMIPERGNLEVNVYKQNWHMLPESHITGENGRIASRNTDAANVVILSANPEAGTARTDGWYDQSYNQVLESPYYYFEKSGVGTTVLDSVIIPFKERELAAADLTAIETSKADAVSYRVDIYGGENEGSVYYYSSPQGGEAVFGDYSTDAKLAVVRFRADGQIAEIVLMDGSSLKSSGKTLIKTMDAVSDISVTYGEEEISISSAGALCADDISIYSQNRTSAALNGMAISVEDTYVGLFERDDVSAIIYTDTGFVCIEGRAGAWHKGERVSLALLKKGVDLSEMSVETIGYISQTSIDENGAYSFQFSFESNIDEYDVYINRLRTLVHKTAVIQMVTGEELYHVQITAESKENILNEYINIKNFYGKRNQTYEIITAFYGRNGTFIGVELSGTNKLSVLGAEDEHAVCVPEGTESIRIFVWDSVHGCRPVTDEVYAADTAIWSGGNE